MPSPSRLFVFGVAAVSLLLHLWLCQFFSFGTTVAASTDINPSNLWKYAYVFPPQGSFLVLNWFGLPNLAPPLTPFTLAARLAPWLFFTTYMPVMATLALLSMFLFLRELELSRAAALFGGIVYAWQGDIIPFILPGHFAYATIWPLLAFSAWSVLRLQRLGHWGYALLSGLGCGQMVELLPDRGGIASLFIAALYFSQIYQPESRVRFWHFFLCVGSALLIALAALAQLFQGAISGVHLAQVENRDQAFEFCTQYSLGPLETLTFLVPGYFGWTTSSYPGPYWGQIGESISWATHHNGARNFNLGISTIGTLPSLCALLGFSLLLPRRVAAWFGPATGTDRQFFYFRWLLGLGLVALVLSWGYHTPLYHPLFTLPLMDKWRNPLKWLEVTSFALTALSAYGAEHLFSTVGTLKPGEEILERRRKLSIYLRWSFFVLLGLWIFSFPQRIYLEGFLTGEGYAEPVIIQILSTLHFSLFLAVLEALLFYCLVRLLWSGRELRSVQAINPWINRAWQGALAENNLPLTLALGLSLLTVLQLSWVDRQFIQPYPYDFLTQTNPLLDALAQEGPLVRVSVATQDPFLNGYLQNQFIAQKISSVDISAASRVPDDLAIFQNTLKDEQARYWFLAGVKNLALPQEMVAQIKNDADVAANVAGADGYTITPTSSADLPSHALVHLAHYLNKATLISHAEFFPTDAALLQRLHDPAWSPLSAVLLMDKDRPTSPPKPVSVTRAGPDVVELKAYTPQEIALETKSSTGGYLLINDHFDPDWLVEINGQPAPLLRADFLLRAIAVTPGDTQINLHYRASYHLLGLRFPDGVVNVFSDGTMLAGWVLAAAVLIRPKKTVKTKSKQKKKIKP